MSASPSPERADPTLSSGSSGVPDSASSPQDPRLGHSDKPSRGKLKAIAPSKDFGRYEILSLLGRGGMGSVYLARDRQLDRTVALKIPHFRENEIERRRERFLREARAAATISHPGLCPIFDVGEHAGVHYLTMAYIEGKPLDQLTKPNQPLPPRAVARLVKRVALALGEAHRHGVVHRDLKPANIMINHRREPIVMDFGLARREQSDDVRVTREGAQLGTPAYMSPEQVNGEADIAGQASDIFSLGIILYELLTGRLPFWGAPSAIFVKIATKSPPPPSHFVPDLPRDLEAICLKALEKAPADRFASMEAFAKALQDWSKGKTVDLAAPVHPLDPLPWEQERTESSSDDFLAELAIESTKSSVDFLDPPRPGVSLTAWVGIGLALAAIGTLSYFLWRSYHAEDFLRGI